METFSHMQKFDNKLILQSLNTDSFNYKKEYLQLGKFISLARSWPRKPVYPQTTFFMFSANTFPTILNNLKIRKIDN